MKSKICKEGLDVLIRLTEFVLLLIIIIDCNSVYRAAVDIPVNMKLFGMVASNVVAYTLIGLFLLKDRANFECIKKHAALFVISLLFCLEFGGLNSVNFIRDSFALDAYSIYNTYFYGYFLFFMNAMVILFRIYRRNHESFRLLYLLENIVIFLAVASLILWVGNIILGFWGRSNDVYVFWGGYHYYSNLLNLYVHRWWHSGDVTKNIGIFTEPPMYGLFLGYALCVELFLKKKSNVGLVLILVISLLSCRAVLALMIAMGAIVLLFMDSIRKRKEAKVLIPAMIGVGLLGAILLCIYKSHVGWGSFATHIDDFVASFKCWKENPILGCGFDYVNPIFNYISDFRADNLGMSNSAGVILAEGGIILFTYYVIPFALMMASFFRGNRKLAYFSLCMFLFWVVVIFHARVFIFFLMALGYSMIDLNVKLFPKEKEQKRFSVSLWNFDENLTDEAGYFKKKMLDLPCGFVAVMAAVMVLTAIYSLTIHPEISVRNNVIMAAVILLQIGALVVHFKVKKLTKREMDWLQIDLWLIFIMLGQPYQALNLLFMESSLRTQDCWWSFLVIVIVLYFAGLIAWKGLKNKAFETKS